MRKSLAAAAVAASLFAGGATGAALYAPNLVAAQTDPSTTPSQEQIPEQAPEPKQWVRDTLQKLVDQGTITQEQADAVAAALADAGPPPGGQHGRGGHHLETTAAALGIDEETLRDELEAGKTIAQVASERGVDVQTVIDALVADMAARLDEGVANGRLTQEQADEMKANATERITAMVNGDLPPGGRRGRGGHGFHGSAPADDEASQSSSGSSSTSPSSRVATRSAASA